MSSQTQDWGLDLGGNASIDELDHGGRMADGFHRVKLVKIEDDSDGNKQLTFEGTHGASKGATQTERINNHQLLDPDKAEKALKRTKMILARLGLITPDMIGNRATLIRWGSIVGREYVIKVQTRNLPKKADGSGGGPFTGLAYDGIYPVDHQDIPNPVRVELGLPPARAKSVPVSSPAAAAAPAVNLDDVFGK